MINYTYMLGTIADIGNNQTCWQNCYWLGEIVVTILWLCTGFQKRTPDTPLPGFLFIWLMNVKGVYVSLDISLDDRKK